MRTGRKRADSEHTDAGGLRGSCHPRALAGYGPGGIGTVLGLAAPADSGPVAVRGCGAQRHRRQRDQGRQWARSESDRPAGSRISGGAAAARGFPPLGLLHSGARLVCGNKSGPRALPAERPAAGRRRRASGRGGNAPAPAAASENAFRRRQGGSLKAVPSTGVGGTRLWPEARRRLNRARGFSPRAVHAGAQGTRGAALYYYQSRYNNLFTQPPQGDQAGSAQSAPAHPSRRVGGGSGLRS